MKVPEKAVEAWAARQLERSTGGVERLDSLNNEKRRKELLAYAHEDLIAILPLLHGEALTDDERRRLSNLAEWFKAESKKEERVGIGAINDRENARFLRKAAAALPRSEELVEERDRIQRELEARLTTQADIADTQRQRAEKAEQELEEVKQRSDYLARSRQHRIERLDSATGQLSQVRAEVEKIDRRADEWLDRRDALLPYDSRRSTYERIAGAHKRDVRDLTAILDSSPSVSGGRGCTESERVRLEDALRLLAITHFDHERLITDENFDCTDLFEAGLVKHIELGQTGEKYCQLTAEGMDAITEALGMDLGIGKTSLSEGTRTVALSPLDRETVGNICDWLESKGTGATQDAAWLRRKLLSSAEDRRP